MVVVVVFDCNAVQVFCFLSCFKHTVQCSAWHVFGFELFQNTVEVASKDPDAMQSMACFFVLRDFGLSHMVSATQQGHDL